MMATRQTMTMIARKAKAPNGEEGRRGTHRVRIGVEDAVRKLIEDAPYKPTRAITNAGTPSLASTEDPEVNGGMLSGAGKRDDYEWRTTDGGGGGKASRWGGGATKCAG